MSQTLRKACTYDNLIIRFLLAAKTAVSGGFTS
jgi:hypothetical protein